MEELISRKAVLDKLQQEHDFYINAYGNRCGFRDLAPKDEKARVDEIGIIRSIIMELPTIPQPKTDGDLISRKAVLSRLNEIKNEKVSRNGELPKIDRAIKCVEELPTISADGDYISRKSVIQLTREMISAEEYGLMDLLDEVKKLPTIPQTDIPQEMLEKAIKCSKSVLDKMSEMSKEELLEIARHCGDSVLEDIKAELEKREDIPYDVEMYDYIQGLEYAISVIDKHISRKE